MAAWYESKSKWRPIKDKDNLAKIVFFEIKDIRQP